MKDQVVIERMDNGVEKVIARKVVVMDPTSKGFQGVLSSRNTYQGSSSQISQTSQSLVNLVPYLV